MNVSKIILLLAVLVAAFVGYRLISSPSQISETGPAELPQPEIETLAEPLPVRVESSAPSTTDETRPCLSIQEFDQHPLTMRATEDLSFLLPNGPDIDAYRGIAAPLVQSYADQGDSAAMALLGAQAVMRAFGADEANAIDWLDGNRSVAPEIYEDKLLSPEAGLELNDAAFWFYEAALHGRLYTLIQYGSVRGRLFGGPVGLGWLTAEELGALPDDEKPGMNPGSLYHQVVLEISPTLRNSRIARLDVGPSDSEPVRVLRESLAHDFRRALAEAELTLPDIPTSTADLQFLAEQICPDQLP